MSFIRIGILRHIDIKMLQTSLLLGFALIINTTSAADAELGPEPQATIQQGETRVAADWELQNQHGEDVQFYRDSAGRQSVVLFWATWCPYCRSLMPHLEAFRKSVEGEPIRFYALNVWEDGDPVAHVLDRGYGFELLLDADSVAKRYGVRGTPGLFVVDEHHRVLYERRSGATPLEVVNALRTALRLQ